MQEVHSAQYRLLELEVLGIADAHLAYVGLAYRIGDFIYEN